MLNFKPDWEKVDRFVLDHFVPIATLVVLILTLIFNLTKKDLNTEIQVYNAIATADKTLEEISVSYAVLSTKKIYDMLAADEIITFDIHSTRRDKAIKNYLDAYDMACLLFQKGKIDKTRFKATYQSKIRVIMENGAYDGYLSPYTHLNNVYNEWERK
jgi:hypothetical protein